jgi:hypothetical protein
LSGRLYIKQDHLRADWSDHGSDVFDLKQRRGWRIPAGFKVYAELESKDLSMYAPQVVNGSPCEHAVVPSACHFVGDELIEGRSTKKWATDTSKGVHTNIWIDDLLGITLKMEVGDSHTYEVKNLQSNSVPDSMFELPTGYEKIELPARTK